MYTLDQVEWDWNKCKRSVSHGVRTEFGFIRSLASHITSHQQLLIEVLIEYPFGKFKRTVKLTTTFVDLLAALYIFDFNRVYELLLTLHKISMISALRSGLCVIQPPTQRRQVRKQVVGYLSVHM
jgi:hypothetical protein